MMALREGLVDLLGATRSKYCPGSHMSYDSARLLPEAGRHYHHARLEDMGAFATKDVCQALVIASATLIVVVQLWS